VRSAGPREALSAAAEGEVRKYAFIAGVVTAGVFALIFHHAMGGPPRRMNVPVTAGADFALALIVGLIIGALAALWDFADRRLRAPKPK
jgi:hypothetical protein